VGLVTSVTGLGNRSVFSPALGLVKNTALDYFLGRALSRWIDNLVLKQVVGIGIGVLISDGIWFWSRGLSVNAPGPGYMVYAAFGLPDVSLLGACVGYLAAALCVTLQQLAPWALIGTIPGVLLYELGPHVGVTLGQERSSGSLAIIGALLAHFACLFLGPLKGAWSVAREGALLSLTVGWVVLADPSAGVLGCFGFVVIGWAIPRWRPQFSSSLLGFGSAPAIGPTLKLGSFFFGWKAFVGGLLGLCVGMFTGYLGGMALWLFAGSAFMHRRAIVERWRWAKSQSVESANTGSATSESLSVSLELPITATSVATSSWLGALFGFLIVAVALVSGLASLSQSDGTGERSAKARDVAPSVAKRKREPVSAPSVATPLTSAPANSTPASSASESASPAPPVASPAQLVASAVAPQLEPSVSQASPSTSATAALPPLVQPSAAPTTSDVKATLAPPAKVEELLRRYYADLNSGDFDANRYFAPRVERYISKESTSTSWINGYIKGAFRKQFQEHHFEMVPGSLRAEATPGEYTFVERAQYYLVAKHTRSDTTWRVRVRIDKTGKLTYFRQFERA
jgi:hypothetical protein